MKKSGSWAIRALLSGLAVLAIAATVAAAEPEYSVDFGTKTGAVKAVNGINLWANAHNAAIQDRQGEAEACHFSTIRLHDVPLDNPGMRLVDVQHIFGNLDADPADPKNYYFDPTDDYIAAIRKGGAVPVYRLGTSIEHSLVKHFAKKPKDPAHYAEICAGIVRHYNAGWANGFEWDLPYWEIWNEPNLIPQMWDDQNWESYCQFYLVVAKRLRSEFPKIKIGGPALTWADPAKLKRLAELCKKEGAPLDFVSWHCYAHGPSELIDPPFAVRKLLDEAGFPDTELHLNEWHYFPTEWAIIHRTKGGPNAKREVIDSAEGLNGVESAAFNDFVLTRWQDGPLTMGNYYAFGLKNWGLYDFYGDRRTVYYSFLLFGDLIHSAPERVKTTDPGGNIALLGSTDAEGNARRLLVSCYKLEDPKPIRVALKGVPAEGEVEVWQIDHDHDYLQTKVKYSDGVLELTPQKSSVFLVRF